MRNIPKEEGSMGEKSFSGRLRSDFLINSPIVSEPLDKITEKMTEEPVLIVGAGPTGLVLAHELARRGIRVRLIDKNSGPAEQSRALVIQVRSLEIFHFMGILDEILAKGQAIGQINLFLRHRLAFRAHFQALESPYPFPLVLPQNDTEQILLSSLERMGVYVERETELLHWEQNSESVSVLLRKNGRAERSQAAWLIGCDGSHSAVRHGLQLSFQGAAYPQLFSLADVKLESSLKADEISLFLEKNGFFAVLPMRKGWVRLLTIDSSGKGEAASEPTLEDFQACVDRFIPGKGKIARVYWLANFHLHHRGAPRYQEGRVFIAGDAAHIHSPAGGQGMNTGIQDAFNLAWKLGMVLQNAAPAQLLESYSLERQPVGAKVLRSTDRFFQLIVSQSAFARFMKNKIFPFIAKFILPRALKRIAPFVSQLQVNYRSSSIVSQASNQSWKAEAPRPGERAPDGSFVQGGKSLSLFDLFQSPQPLLLFFSEKGDQAPRMESLSALARRWPRRWDLVTLSPSPLHARYGIEGEGLYLIRPDRYVAWRQQGLGLAEFEAFLGKHFG